MLSYQYRDSTYKDKMVWWPSNLYEKPYTRKDVLYIETGHWFSVGAMYVDIMVKMNMVKMATFKNIFEGSQEI